MKKSIFNIFVCASLLMLSCEPLDNVELNEVEEVSTQVDDPILFPDEAQPIEVYVFQGPTEGMGMNERFFISKVADETGLPHLALTIQSNVPYGELGLSDLGDEVTLDIIDSRLAIEIGEWDRSVVNHFTNDGIDPDTQPEKLQTWSPNSGKITIKLVDLREQVFGEELLEYYQLSFVLSESDFTLSTDEDRLMHVEYPETTMWFGFPVGG